MFNEIKADVPLKLPCNKNLIDGEVEIYVESGSVTIEFTDPHFADLLMEQLCAGTLLSVHVIPQKAKENAPELHLVTGDDAS